MLNHLLISITDIPCFRWTKELPKERGVKGMILKANYPDLSNGHQYLHLHHQNQSSCSNINTFNCVFICAQLTFCTQIAHVRCASFNKYLKVFLLLKVHVFSEVKEPQAIVSIFSVISMNMILCCNAHSIS